MGLVSQICTYSTHFLLTAHYLLHTHVASYLFFVVVVVSRLSRTYFYSLLEHSDCHVHLNSYLRTSCI